MVVGALEGLKSHAERMRKRPVMEHDEPYRVRVAGGKTETLYGSSPNRASSTSAASFPGTFKPA